MSEVMTATLLESSTTYHLDSSANQYTPLEAVKTKSPRSIPVIRVRESATGGSEFIDDEIPLDVFHALGDLSSKIDVAALQFRFVSSPSMRLDVGVLKRALPRQNSCLTYFSSKLISPLLPHPSSPSSCS